MPDPKSPELYSLKKTTITFAVASIILLISLIGMVMQDSIRDWKYYQREFMAYSRRQAEEEKKNLEKKQDKKKIEELKAALAKADQDRASKKNEIREIEKKLEHLDVELIKARSRYQDLKQVQDSDRYFFEENRVLGHAATAEKYAQKLKRREPALNSAKEKQEQTEKEIEDLKSELSALNGAHKEAAKAIEKANQDIIRLNRKIENLKPNLAQTILNAPMLDFLKPSLRIQQVVLEDLYDDFYYTKSKKVDRCITCHLGIDQKGFENAPQPFRTHPRLELILGSDSPHPLEEIGCTVCHGGSGHSSNFVTAAHTPQDDKQADEWKKKYGWKPMKHWGEKMLPLQYAEAACAKCHQGVVDVPQAPKLNEGRKLAETFGCTGCHKVEGMERWKAGPSLLNVQSKLEQDWIARWLHNPKEFRPSTKMPRIFHLSNAQDSASEDKDNAVISSIAAYLMKNSDSATLEKSPQKGNAENGKKLVETIGCLGCHSSGDSKLNDHGPELTGLGSKVTEDWLFTWLKNPKHLSPNTRMPDLRLTDKEASDIAAYLLDQKNEKFDSLKLPRVKSEALREIALAFLSSKMRHQDAVNELDKMTEDDKLLFVGEKSIAHQGCFGCHDIKGFETAKPIGTELTEEGSKDIHKLDFGYLHMPHTREAFFSQKLSNPRIYDQGREKTYHEKLKMPQFNLSDEQIQRLTLFLLSQQKTHIPEKMKRQLDLREKQIEEGRLTVRQMNCQGCHTLDGVEGRIRDMVEDKGNAPPVVDGEGKKVQPEWLYAFLHQPETIRPWLKFRMPSFGFDEKHLNQLVEYFQNLDGVKPALAKIHPEINAPKTQDGKKLFQAMQCIKCHKSNPEPGLTASFLAPDLTMAKDRLRPEWVVEWMKDPQQLQEGTMMPTFFSEGQSPLPDILNGDYIQQSEAIRDYLWNFTPEEARIFTPAPASTGQASQKS